MSGVDLDAVPISDKRAKLMQARLACNPRDHEAKAELIAAGRDFITKEQGVKDLKDLEFRKSSYSSPNGDNCVEIAETPDGGRAIRDSKDQAGPVLRFTAAEWDAFGKGFADGEFA